MKLVKSPGCYQLISNGELCEEVESVRHYLMYCPAFSDQRAVFMYETKLSTANSLDEWLGVAPKQPQARRNTIINALNKYITETKRFLPSTSCVPEKIVGTVCEAGTTWYRIKWLGYSMLYCTWLHEALAKEQIPDMLNEFVCSNNVSQ